MLEKGIALFHSGENVYVVKKTLKFVHIIYYSYFCMRL